MRQAIADRMGPTLFVVSIVIMAVIYGTVSSWWGWFPAPQISLAHRTYLDIAENWRNDLALEPTRHLITPGGANAGPDRGFSGALTGATADGYVLVAGLSRHQDESFHSVTLYDGAGNEVHRWPIRYAQFDERLKPQNVMLHGMEVFEDGSVVVTFDSGDAIARVDACGATMWKVNGAFHHAITRDGEGNLVAWQGDIVTWLDEDTGETVKTLDLKDMLAVDDGAQKAMFDMRTRTPDTADEDVGYLPDPHHTNDVEALRADMAGAFPMFEAGDVLISMREINLVAVVDPDTGRMKWWRHGPWFKQHDPDFQPDGTITVYDNATGTGKSRILKIRPGEDEVETVFAGSDAVPFYSWRRGKHQYLPDGNILLTEAEGGRILEITPAGELVWERHMVWDDDHNLVATEARYVPSDFFTNGTPRCPSPL